MTDDRRASAQCSQLPPSRRQSSAVRRGGSTLPLLPDADGLLVRHAGGEGPRGPPGGHRPPIPAAGQGAVHGQRAAQAGLGRPGLQRAATALRAQGQRLAM